MKNVCKRSKYEGCITKCHHEAVYSGVFGPMQVDSIGGNRYFVTPIDDHSRKLLTYLIKGKDGVL